MDPGFVNVKQDLVGPWEDFVEALQAKLGSEDRPSFEGNISAIMTASGLSADIGGPRLLCGIVKDTFVIADNSVDLAKMHTEIELPKGVAYQAGDYLSILADNSVDNVRRVSTHFSFGLVYGAEIKGTNKQHLQTKIPISVMELLGIRAELNTPITQCQLKKLITFTNDLKEKISLESLSEDKMYNEKLLAKRFPIINILKDHPSCAIPFAGYLAMLKSMSIR